MRILTHQMTGAPTGDVVDMGGPCAKLRITARAACWVRAVLGDASTSAPSAPAATPAPAAGAEAPQGWVYLAANDVLILQPDVYGVLAYRYVEIWELAAGLITVEQV